MAAVPDEIPANLRQPDAPRNVRVESQPFDDARTVEFVLDEGPESSIHSPTTGTVTKSACARGTTLRSGMPILDVDDSPIVGLATAIPLWRNLHMGDSGDDVLALQEELSRLGQTVVVDGKFGAATETAMRKFLRVAGVDAPAEGLPHSAVVWLPAASVSVKSCGVEVGSPVAAGDEALTVLPSAASLHVLSMPRDLLPGPRELRFKEARVAIDASGDSSDVAAEFVSATRSVESQADDGEAKPLSGEVNLVSPVEVAGIPPSSVLAVSANRGCVQSGNEMIPISVVGSRLGRTLAIFDSRRTALSVRLEPDGHRRCT